MSVMLRDVAAHAAFRAGVRDAVPRARSAARKVLLPTLATCGGPHYARAVSLELVMIQYRAPPEVRALVEDYLTTHNGQGWDFILEERNGNVKVLVGDNTVASWKFANAFQDVVPEMASSIHAATGVNAALHDGHPVTRTPIDMTETYKLMEGRVHANSLLMPSSEPRPPASLGGTVLLPTAAGYYVAGQAKMAETLAVIQACKPGDTPVPPPMSAFKITVGEKAKGGATAAGAVEEEEVGPNKSCSPRHPPCVKRSSLN